MIYRRKGNLRAVRCLLGYTRSGMPWPIAGREDIRVCRIMVRGRCDAGQLERMEARRLFIRGGLFATTSCGVDEDRASLVETF